MTTHLNKIFLASAVFASIIGVPMLAAAQKSETLSRTYSYDKNKDGFIQQDEFTTYLYSRSDMDGDGYMGDEEWKMTTTQLYRPYKDLNYNTYAYWDNDKDGRLDTSEVTVLVEKTDLYSKWDINHDGKVDNDEFEKGSFSAYDDNGDGSLSLSEWKSVLR